MKSTKNGNIRIIPISNNLYSSLRSLRFRYDQSDDTFVFSLTNGLTPVDDTAIRNGFYKALDRFGIDEAERKRMNLNFHSWRHYANTMMQYTKIPDIVIRQIIGHKSSIMTNHYTQQSINEIMDSGQYLTSKLLQ